MTLFRHTYPVQHENKYDREVLRLDAIRAHLGWEPGLLNGKGWRPKGMHWQTFYRLKAEHDELVASVVGHMDARLMLAADRLSPPR
ncbi:hypothetical protein OL229_13675 [Neisseriaceae bacterium JH1-16]|nr:hypothetical protein [Neisseriaceae bacterium JH1-16]